MTLSVPCAFTRTRHRCRCVLINSRGTARHAAFLGLTVTILIPRIFALGFITLLASGMYCRSVCFDTKFRLRSDRSASGSLLIKRSSVFRTDHPRTLMITRTWSGSDSAAFSRWPNAFTSPTGCKWIADNVAQFACPRYLRRIAPLSVSSCSFAFGNFSASGWLRSFFGGCV
jgi:hypothetical protein